MADYGDPKAGMRKVPCEKRFSSKSSIMDSRFKGDTSPSSRLKEIFKEIEKCEACKEAIEDCENYKKVKEKYG